MTDCCPDDVPREHWRCSCGGPCGTSDDPTDEAFGVQLMREGIDRSKEPRPEHVVKAAALREAARAFFVDMPNIYERLHELADALDPPAPPRPAEPTGHNAVVLDKDGIAWQRPRPVGQYPWVPTWGRQNTIWAALVEHYGPVTVLSEGVTD